MENLRAIFQIHRDHEAQDGASIPASHNDDPGRLNKKWACQGGAASFILFATENLNNLISKFITKRIFLALIVMCGMAAFSSNLFAAQTSDKIVWAGIDYSMAKFIGTDSFRNPEAIFPRMLEAWNELFLQERIPVVEKMTKKEFVPDIGGVTKANKSASAKQIIDPASDPDDTIDSTHITPEMIAREVKSYQMESQGGLGVVFIVDRFVKPVAGANDANGAVYVVTFDVATREVISSQREVSRPGGFGFRNYWFRIIKNSERGLKTASLNF